MFEKEAEEYQIRKHYQRLYGHKPVVMKELNTTFKDGAEFGYNKAFVEADKNLKAVVADFNKVNEWHYVKDKDYPKDNKPVLCILGDIDEGSCEVGYYNDVGNGEPWHFETYHLPDDDGDNAWGVFAWKEIVLPEIKESE